MLPDGWPMAALFLLTWVACAYMEWADHRA